LVIYSWGTLFNRMERSKIKRFENPELLDYIKHNLPCVACTKFPDETDICAHHVRTRGSGGHDIPENLMPLCKSCHVKIHAIGTNAMAKQHESVKKWLILANWEWDKYTNKWRYYGNEEAE
jgi:hypothetical protein